MRVLIEGYEVVNGRRRRFSRWETRPDVAMVNNTPPGCNCGSCGRSLGPSRPPLTDAELIEMARAAEERGDHQAADLAHGLLEIAANERARQAAARVRPVRGVMVGFEGESVLDGPDAA